MAVDESAGVKGICRAIGDELRRARERKKASLADVAKKTKINPKYLQSIEEGDFGFLPEPYVRAFIRAYAQEVGLEPLTMLKPLDRVRERLQEAKYIASVHASPREVRLMSLWNKVKALVSGRKFSVLLFLAGAVVVGVLVIIYAANYERLFGGRKTEMPPLSSRAQDARLALTEELRLELEAVGDTWVQVVADDSTVSDAFYARGEHRTVRAQRYVRLRVADAGALIVTLNGRPLQRLGEEKQEVVARIERDGIVSSTIGGWRTESSPVDVEQYRGGLRRGDL
ncbi:MAG: helix-turn-helix domain-containing protein [Candidatus Oleimicrobiaceae bacterium]